METVKEKNIYVHQLSLSQPLVNKPLAPKNLSMNPKRKTIAILAVSVAIVLIALSIVPVFTENHAENIGAANLTRVACLGDSITQVTGYPADLQALLGNNSTIGNFGVSGSTVNFHSGEAYYFEPAFHNAKAFEPTTVIIMLGTNDAHADVTNMSTISLLITRK